MTTANKITIFRILLVPFFIVQTIDYMESGKEINRFMALLSFAVAAISDGVDGFIARRYSQRSELGRVLDPLADKLLLVSGIILLSFQNDYLGKIPLWFTATVLSRDTIILLGLVVIHYVVGKVTVRPHLIGKVATVLQMVSVVWLFLKWDLNLWKICAVGATLCTGISGILYTLNGMKQLSASPSSSPTPKQ